LTVFAIFEKKETNESLKQVITNLGKDHDDA